MTRRRQQQKITTKNVLMLATVAAVLSLVLVSGPALQHAFAHSNVVITPSEEHANKIKVVLGHTNEPSFALEEGIHNTVHNVDIRISDAATSLPIPNANLKIDKYYFKDVKGFDKAESVEEATKVEKGATVAAVHGEAGSFKVEQRITEPGIYGYRIYGTVNYFDVANITVDVTKFCSMSEGGGSGPDLTKFDSSGWKGGYNCPADIEDIYWPGKINDKKSTKETSTSGEATTFAEAEIQQVGLEQGDNEDGNNGVLAASTAAAATPPGATIQPTVSSSGIATLQILAAGLPMAAVAGFFGIRMFRQHRRDRLL